MNKYWFRKRKGLFTKDLGYGWVPISWEGWAVLLGCLTVIVLASFSFDLYGGSTTFFQGIGFAIVVIAVIVFGAFVSNLKVKP